ncbi:MAG: LysM peptidoglycan-binding domain-containing protein [Lachnospiraceae bacterium]|nr:LysM peptidoglycan-binding domain-containing protein [Lachnospiraceae bacterium]
MDLPKNVTQIGEADAACKIYVEDYVVSYLKQLNPLARDKTMAAALYGKRKSEDGKNYLFVYGAGKLDFIQKETKHLSQAQLQEIERIRRMYFAEYEFLGYRILDGEMVEGFHVCEQETCRYVAGYAQFYEKNEAMLSYMLESRQVEATPEAVNNEKYDAARNRQEKRRAKYTHHYEPQEEETGNARARKGGLQVAAVAVLALLCALGLAMNSSVLEEHGISWDKLKTEFREKKLSGLTAVSGQSVVIDEETETTATAALGKAEVGEPKMAGKPEGSGSVAELSRQDGEEGQAGEASQQAAQGQAGEASQQAAQGQAGETSQQAAQGQAGEASQQAAQGQAGEASQQAAQGQAGAEQTQKSVTADGTKQEGKDMTKTDTQEGQNAAGNGALGEKKSTEADGQKDNGTTGTAEANGQKDGKEAQRQPEIYVVCAGDTLTGISIRTYGSEKYIKTICQYNSIKNPDEIKIGQKIILP